MLPNNSLSTISSAAIFTGSRKTPPRSDLEDRETINIPVNQFIYEPEDWTGVSDGTTIVLSSLNEPDQLVVTDENITEFSFTFDQNKRAIVAYVADNVAKLRWYDFNVNQMTTTVYGNTYISPRVSLDDKHRLGNDTSDVIFAYIRDGSLRYRQQRDSYNIEYTLSTVDPGTKIRRIGMNVINRFQFELYKE